MTQALATRRLWCAFAAISSNRSVGRSMTSSSSPFQADKIEWTRFQNDPNRIFLLDGGTGEELFKRGVPDDRKIWSATALVYSQYHSALADVHRSFLAAGSMAITTNSYGVTPGVGFSSREIAEHVTTAGRIARQVAEDFSKSNDSNEPKLVLGSMGPLLESYRPDKLMDHEEGVQVYGVIAKSLLPFVDIFIAETMSCVKESSQAIQAVAQLSNERKREDGKPSSLSPCRPMLVSYTLGSDGNLWDGESATSAVSETLNLCQQHGVELLGVLFNCAEPEAISKALQSIRADSVVQRSLSERGVRTGAFANRLTPVDPNWSLKESNTPQATRIDMDAKRYSEEFVSSWVKDYGAMIVGGCCGITPEYIAAINARLQ